MGTAKDYMMQAEEHGYYQAPEKNVCAKMFPHQRYIREKIHNSYNEGNCDYCKEYGSIVELNNIVKMVYDEFLHYFEDPANGLPFESGGEWDELDGSGFHKEGAGYLLPDNRTIMTTEEALQWAGFQPASEELFNDIVKCFYYDSWVLKDTFEWTSEERMSKNWDDFCHNTIKDFCSKIKYRKIRDNSELLLQYISEKIGSNLHALSTLLKKKDILYRCVNYVEVPKPMLPQNLWAPPVEYANSQRMSREGQSRLYASFDRETPIHEAVSYSQGMKHCLGKFSLKQDIQVLDFTQIPEPVILNVPDFIAYRFFERFANAITQRVGEHEKYKYVPTQLMRDIIEEDYMHRGIMGIKYNSVKGNGTSNVVLFLDNDTCKDYLNLESFEVIE